MRSLFLLFTLISFYQGYSQTSQIELQQPQHDWNIKPEYTAFQLASFNKDLLSSTQPVFNQKVSVEIIYQDISLSLSYLSTQLETSSRKVKASTVYALTGGFHSKHFGIGLNYNTREFFNIDLQLKSEVQFGETYYGNVDFENFSNPDLFKQNVDAKPTVNFSFGGKLKVYSLYFIDFYLHADMLLFKQDKINYDEKYAIFLQNSFSAAINIRKLWGTF